MALLKQSLVILKRFVYFELIYQVCGLKWNPDGNRLASGGNDNKLLVWDKSRGYDTPLFQLNQHTAAVKAIAWSPYNGMNSRRLTSQAF